MPAWVSLARWRIAKVALLGWAMLYACAAGAAAPEGPEAPWRAADTIRRATAAIERTLYREPDEAGREAAADALHEAGTAYGDALAAPVAELDLALAKRLDDAFAGLNIAVRDWSLIGAAESRALVWTGLLDASYRRVMAAFDAGDMETARRWLALREYAKASRDTAAADALDAAIAGAIAPERARAVVEAELLRVYAGELRRSLANVREAGRRGYGTQFAHEVARARGLAMLLRPNLERRLGEAPTRALDAHLGRLDGRSDLASVNDAVAGAEAILSGYSPVELTAEDREHRARLFARFLKLVFMEYKDGVRDGRISVHVEYEEARLFRARAAMVLGDLSGALAGPHPEAHARLADILAEMHETIEAKGPADQVGALSEEAVGIVTDVFGIDTGQSGHAVAFQMLPDILDEMVLLAGQGDYPGADLKRLEAYSFFDPDIEQRLVPRSPTLSLRLESLFWEGNAARPGLGALLDAEAPVGELKETVAEVNARLADARAILDARLGASGAFVQSLAIILREGLEAILVIAAVIGALRASGGLGYARYIWGGAALAVAASFALWLAAGRLITVSTSNRELLEGGTALLAAAVVVYVTNWLFHKAYVTDWTALVRAQARESVSDARLGWLGFLSFAVVFREGFETVLFYEALMIDASPVPVLAGFVAGLAGTVVLAVLALRLGLRLPLGAFFKATGLLLMILAVVFTGVGIRGLQTAGLIGATPVPGFPESSFLQLYLGIYPVAETLIGQAIVLAIMLGGWLWMKRRGGSGIAAGASAGAGTR